MPGMNRGDNLEEIYAWIDEIPFSKPKKNICRDFSDGVLMAEILKIYYPRFADVHNYIPANNVAAKKENWNTLNRKVFSKIDMKLSKDVINQLANAQQGIIEQVLIDLRNKILTKDTSLSKEHSMDIECNENLIGSEEKIVNNSMNIGIIKENENPRSYVSATGSNKNFIDKACGWLVGWIWPFKGSMKSTETVLSSPPSISTVLEPHGKNDDSFQQPVSKIITEDGDENGSRISHLDFLRLRQEVQEKSLAISMLNRKVSRLESVMKLKDQKIGNLAAQISASSTETAQNLRPHVIGSSISRLRSQAKAK